MHCILRRGSRAPAHTRSLRSALQSLFQTCPLPRLTWKLACRLMSMRSQALTPTFRRQIIKEGVLLALWQRLQAVGLCNIRNCWFHSLNICPSTQVLYWTDQCIGGLQEARTWGKYTLPYTVSNHKWSKHVILSFHKMPDTQLSTKSAFHNLHHTIANFLGPDCTFRLCQSNICIVHTFFWYSLLTSYV